MQAPKGSKRWFAAASLPNREAIAYTQLERQGFETFFPKRIRTIRHARKSMERVVSYFPGYLFVALDLEVDRWRSVNGTYGVRSLIMEGERPLPVPAGIVESLQDFTDERGFLKRIEDLKPGDRVKVQNGHMADMIGEIDRLDGKNRVRVLIEMLHGQVPTIIDRTNVAKHNEVVRQPGHNSTGGRKPPGVR